MKRSIAVTAFFVCISLPCVFADPGIFDRAEQLVQAGKIAESLTLLEQGLASASSSFEKAEFDWRLSRNMLFLAATKKLNNAHPDELCKD